MHYCVSTTTVSTGARHNVTLYVHCLHCFLLLKQMIHTVIRVYHVIILPPPHSLRFLVGQGLLIIEASRSHLDTSHPVALLWMNYQPDAKTPASQHTTFTRDRHPCGRRDPNTIPSRERPQTHALHRAGTGSV